VMSGGPMRAPLYSPTGRDARPQDPPRDLAILDEPSTDTLLVELRPNRNRPRSIGPSWRAAGNAGPDLVIDAPDGLPYA
jgi:hypothetical protein